MKKESTYELDIFESLPTRAKELFFEERCIDEYIFQDLEYAMNVLKSPIEKILYVAMAIHFVKNDIFMFVNCQKEIKIDGKKYIADFVIEYDKYMNYYLNEDFKLVIECDGYEWHHANKKQVENDYERENALKLNGYDVIRFTGSKIYKEPIECVKEIIEYIKNKHKK